MARKSDTKANTTDKAKQDLAARRIHKLFESLKEPGEASAVKSIDLELPTIPTKSLPVEQGNAPTFRQEADDLANQNFQHRDTLLKLVVGLSLAGFILLSVATIAQMTFRIWNPDYTGISDTALNILAVSVFGEVIAVVATIVRLVWKSNTKER